MKKTLLVIALIGVMLFAFAATAMADHSPVFYFDFQEGAHVTQGAAFLAVFPPTAMNVIFSIDNGSGADASPHGGYSQTSAKCGVCHAVHRAPMAGTSAFATADNGGTGTSSSKYKGSAWTADASTQMLLRSTVAASCNYCHVTSGPEKMYGGDPSYALNGNTAFGWGEFYGHTSGCTSCHAVHGANTFKGAGVAGFILKAAGVKNLGTIPLVVQPEVYGGGGALYASKADMLAGNVANGADPLQAAVTAQCSICHASYAVGEETINANYLNGELFQPASWATANGATTKIFVGTSGSPVSVLPGVPGLTYTTDINAPGSLIMAYKNHPLKAGGALFNGAGASAGAKLVSVSGTGSKTCQSCHSAPTSVVDGGYMIQSFPHYTPGYYKFMTAQNQSAFDYPQTAAEYLEGRAVFFNSIAGGGKPAVMNDGFCTKCHTNVGVDY